MTRKVLLRAAAVAGLVGPWWLPALALAQMPSPLPPVTVGPDQTRQPSRATPQPLPPVDLSAPAGSTESITVGGRARTFVLVRPAAPGPHPTIVVLHGFNGTGAQIARRTGLDWLGPRDGFVAVFPDGLRNRWNFYPPGKEPPVFVEGSRQIGGIPNDVGFLELLVADLVRGGISDPKRIYLAGYSNGGFMTLRMLCAGGGPFAAVGLLAGGMPEPLGADCGAQRPIAALLIHGTADQVVPYAGGLVQPGNVFSAWPTQRLVEFLRGLNGCGGAAEQSVLPDASRNKVEVVRWTACIGAPMAFYRVIGGDHSAPWQVDVGRLLLDFFRDKARRTKPAL